MGDWMTVRVTGTCPLEEVEDLRRFLTATFGPLTPSVGLCGLGEWPGYSMDRVGNCAERGYTPEDVADQLRGALKVAPGLRLKVHCGGPYEQQLCVATVTAAEGLVSIGRPGEVQEVGEIDPGRVMEHLLAQLSRQRG